MQAQISDAQKIFKNLYFGYLILDFECNLLWLVKQKHSLFPKSSNPNPNILTNSNSQLKTHHSKESAIPVIVLIFC